MWHTCMYDNLIDEGYWSSTGGSSELFCNIYYQADDKTGLQYVKATYIVTKYCISNSNLGS